MYVIFKNLDSVVGKEVRIHDVLTFQIIELLIRDNNQHLDGRILQLLAAWKVKNIDFWL